MKSRTRVVSALLVALMLATPLATIASAQQPPPPPAPEMFQDSLKAQQAAEADRKIYDAGAIATNVFLVPGRAITCVLGGAVGIAASRRDAWHRLPCRVGRHARGLRWQVDGDRRRPAARRADRAPVRMGKALGVALTRLA